MNHTIQCVAFDGSRKIAAGELREVAVKAQKTGLPNILIFNDATSEVIDLDLGGTARELRLRLGSETPTASPAEEPKAPGRPKLGVVAREVTLLPRHWEWLTVQPGGASVALRKLVDEARRAHRDIDRLRLAKEATYRFLSAMAGDEEGFEEAARGLFAGDAIQFAQHSRTWPLDVREHAANLAARVFEGSET